MASPGASSLKRRARGALLALASLALVNACASRSEPSWRERAEVAAPSHCLSACPPVPDGDRLVEHTLFTLANDPDTKFANWVAYVVRARHSGGPNRPRNWRDPEVPEEETLERDDYEDANSVNDYEMGHQAPLETFSNSSAWAETNYLSNITPQVGNLNGGRWRVLEGS